MGKVDIIQTVLGEKHKRYTCNHYIYGVYTTSTKMHGNMLLNQSNMTLINALICFEIVLKLLDKCEKNRFGI